MVRGRWCVVLACLVLSAGLGSPTEAQRQHSQDVNNPRLLPFLQDDGQVDPQPPNQDRQPSIKDGITRSGEKGVGGRVKRVFLSRGWGPGGYEAPSPPAPHRFVRRPLPPPQPLRTRLRSGLNSPSPPTRGRSLGGARFAALVSSVRQRPPPPSQPKASPRRFHSIFTSGTWRPLGKRGIQPLLPLEPSDNSVNDYLDEVKRSMGDILGDGVRIKELKGKAYLSEDQDILGFQDEEPSITVQEAKRSGVFTSHGWGAGGSPTPSHHPWSPLSPASNVWESPFIPRMGDMSHMTSWNEDRHVASGKGHVASGERHVASGDRHLVSFRGSSPLFHLFLSHGWGPMGR